MKLLLVFALATVILGLVTDRFNGWVLATVVGGSVVTAALFFFTPRFWL